MNKNTVLKILFSIVVLATPSKHAVVEPSITQGLWQTSDPSAIKFCSQELQASVQNSSQELIREVFGNWQAPSEPDQTKEAQEKASDKLANLNIKKLKTIFSILETDNPQQTSDTFACALKFPVCKDLRMLSNNPNAGLQSIFQKLFGRTGQAPLRTSYGQAVAMLALTNPTADLEKLVSRAEKIKTLVADPQLLKKLEKKLKEFAKAQEQSYDLLFNPKIQPQDELTAKKYWFWQKEYKEAKKKEQEAVFSTKDCKEFNDGLFDGTVKPIACSTLQTIGSIPFLLLLSWAQNGLYNDRNPANKDQYRLIGLPAILGINLLHSYTYMFNEYSTIFKSMDKFVPINKSKIINFNLFMRPFTEKKTYSSSFDHQLKWAFENFMRFLVFQSLVKTFPNFMTGIAYRMSETFARPFAQKFCPSLVNQLMTKDQIRNWMATKPSQEAYSDFFPSIPELVSQKTKTGLAAAAVLAFLYLKPFAQSAQALYKKRFAIKNAKKQLSYLKRMIAQAKLCQELFDGHSGEFDRLTSKTNPKDSFANACWPMLNSKTFDDPDSTSCFFNYGAVIATYKFLSHGLVTSNQEDVPTTIKADAPICELTKLMKAIGEIDLCIALAKLVLSSPEDSNNKFCIAEFVDQPNAFIEVKKGWHPLCQRSQAVSNDACLGSQNQDNSSHGQIVTGGNSTGKSIYTSCITINAYLAQCLGVAPATSLTMTPFDKFITQINTQDDPIKKKSLFRVQIRQVGEIAREIIDSDDQNKKIMACLDESLSGTPPMYARALLSSVMRTILKDRKNYAMIFATHLKELAKEVQAQTNGKITPMKILCKTGPNGEFESSTFKACPGVSDLDSALIVASEEWEDLLPEELVGTILNQAKATIATPAL